MPKIHIALTPWDLSDSYNRHAGATLLSILNHCTEPVVIHLLYDEKRSDGKDEEVKYNKSCFQNIADKYHSQLIYHHVELPSWINETAQKYRWTLGTLMRLCLPDILPEIDKIIYFDCDMIINTSINKLWSIDLGDMYLAACLDEDISRHRRKRRQLYAKLGISDSNYFCAGTLVLNLKKLRELGKSFSDIVFGFFHQHLTLPYLDQDLLNWVCQGKFVVLDGKYNIYSYNKDALNRAKDGVIHYASPNKPWKVYTGPIDNYYWKYVSQTPWLENRDDLIDAVRSAPNITICSSLIPETFVVCGDTSYSDKLKLLFGFMISYHKAACRKIIQELKR